MMTFKEKSLWIILLTTLLFFGFYFVIALRVLVTVDPNAKLPGLFIIVTIAFSIVVAVTHTVLVIINKRDRAEAQQDEDEREKLIELKSTQVSSYVLAGGVWFTIISIFFSESLLWTANLLMFFFILSEVFRFAMELFYIRRGI